MKITYEFDVPNFSVSEGCQHIQVVNGQLSLDVDTEDEAGIDPATRALMDLAEKHGGKRKAVKTKTVKRKAKQGETEVSHGRNRT